MFVGSPLVKAKQDRSIGVQDLPEVIMSGIHFRLAKQRLIPLEAASNICNSDDCPSAFHCFLLWPNVANEPQAEGLAFSSRARTQRIVSLLRLTSLPAEQSSGAVLANGVSRRPRLSRDSRPSRR